MGMIGRAQNTLSNVRIFKFVSHINIHSNISSQIQIVSKNIIMIIFKKKNSE